MAAKTITTESNPTTERIELRGEHALSIVRGVGADELVLGNASGTLRLSLRVTDAGVEVALDGAALTMRSDAEIAIDAKRLRVHGREGVEITSGADLKVGAVGDTHLVAQEHVLEATRGDVRMRANDDVRLDGERVLLNCEDARKR